MSRRGEGSGHIAGVDNHRIDINPSISKCTLRGIFERRLLVEGSDFIRVVLQLAHG